MSEWFYMVGGRQTGPVSSKQLKELASAGQVSPDTLIWKTGLAKWLKATSVKGLFAVPVTTEPPPLSMGQAATQALPSLSFAATQAANQVMPSVSHALQRFKTKRWAVAAVSVVLLIGSWWFLFSGGSVTKHNFERVKVGMRESRVKSILGDPDSEVGDSSKKALKWKNEDDGYTVVVEFNDGKVSDKMSVKP